MVFGKYLISALTLRQHFAYNKMPMLMPILTRFATKKNSAGGPLFYY